uniref:Uncharacterized protein n=1 Tax=Timema cristinae TaxID=61476 RepID=A0A7R9DLE8_TIMCR|nr:unnamed protein product [Timema cristinae]
MIPDFLATSNSDYMNLMFSPNAQRCSYESADGTKVEASGTLKDLGDKEGPSSVIQGSYSFVTADGQLFELRYIADENGFQPQASFLPVAPPIPEEIQRSLEYNAAHPEEDNLRK